MCRTLPLAAEQASRGSGDGDVQWLAGGGDCPTLIVSHTTAATSPERVSDVSQRLPAGAAGKASGQEVVVMVVAVWLAGGQVGPADRYRAQSGSPERV
jgi:hypothetical protein